jgi:hypothetical protein
MDPLKDLLQGPALETTLYPPESRYHGLTVTEREQADGRTVRYLKRRFVPGADRLQVVGLHSVAQGDRLDNVSARYLGDPLQAWRLCDANSAMRPEELTETPGTRLRIALPQGVSGSSND